MKRWIILMLTLVFAVGLFTACAGGNAGNDSSSRRPTQNIDDGEWTPPY